MSWYWIEKIAKLASAPFLILIFLGIVEGNWPKLVSGLFFLGGGILLFLVLDEKGEGEDYPLADPR